MDAELIKIIAITKRYTDDKVSDAVTSVYTLAGSCLFSELPPLAADYLGYVHTVSEDFTTTADFVEGSGKTFPAGTNVTVVNAGNKSNPIYKYDASIGDLSVFQTKNLSQAISGNTTVEQALSALSRTKANDADLAEVARSGSYGDLSDTPTNVSDFENDAGYLTQHQDITGKADKVVSATGGNFAALDVSGNLTDSKKSPSDYYTKTEIDDLLKQYLKLE